MAARKNQSTFTKVERAVTSAARSAAAAADEYVVEPVKKLVGMDSKGKGKKRSASAARKSSGTAAKKRSATTAGKRKPSTTSRSGGVTRRSAGTPGSRSR